MNSKTISSRKTVRLAGVVALTVGAFVLWNSSSASAKTSYSSASGSLRGVSVEMNGTIQAVSIQGSGAKQTYPPCSPTKMADHPHLLRGAEPGYTLMLQIQDNKCFMRTTLFH